ncbi:hypothetical protein ACFT9M_06555 [Micromonospora purpureochromogenes]|uniref:hypothetical protein n=1 Tax=Micromonospora purpureochromogenes TaxID=47872 RepID=UPI00363B86B9
MRDRRPYLTTQDMTGPRDKRLDEWVEPGGPPDRTRVPSGLDAMTARWSTASLSYRLGVVEVPRGANQDAHGSAMTVTQVTPDELSPAGHVRSTWIPLAFIQGE